MQVAPSTTQEVRSVHHTLQVTGRGVRAAALQSLECEAARSAPKAMSTGARGGHTGWAGAHLEAERRRLVQRTVALVCSPAATRRPMVPSTAALGASRLGCASSSPNT